eukprot:359193-Chlamydomonas_euryale.AAC.10
MAAGTRVTSPPHNRQPLHTPPHLHGQRVERGDGNAAALREALRARQPHGQPSHVQHAADRDHLERPVVQRRTPLGRDRGAARSRQWRCWQAIAPKVNATHVARDVEHNDALCVFGQRHIDAVDGEAQPAVQAATRAADQVKGADACEQRSRVGRVAVSVCGVVGVVGAGRHTSGGTGKRSRRLLGRNARGGARGGGACQTSCCL